jgi:hypothetical protein
MLRRMNFDAPRFYVHHVHVMYCNGICINLLVLTCRNKNVPEVETAFFKV